MPTLYDVKPAFQKLLRPLTVTLAAAGVTANQITMLAMTISLATAALVASFAERRVVFLLVPVALIVRMALNAIDGMLAREHGQASNLGMYLNELCDVVSDLALVLSFLAVPLFAPWGVIGFALLAVIVEYAGVLGIPAGIGRNYAGPFGKSDRAFGLGIVAVLVASGLWPDLAPFIFPVMALLSLWTVANRIRAGLRPASV